jgi:hypothetical protein
MALPLNDWMIWLILGFLGLVVVGWIIQFRSQSQSRRPLEERWRKLAWTLLQLTVIFAVLQYIYYNTEFYQMQGRYLYPMLIPLGIWVALGFDGWRHLIFREQGMARWIVVCPVALFVPFNLFIIWRVIPLLAPGG